ncbi:SpoIVB peptidase [Desulfofundulus thermobenzoicus]|uniref:SpoIVB peptidase n=2 Tax=Desulfofundulus thermobenzoicus TaxID=29376 RepID=A0A6N7IPX0_9FIRM|nr:SpoIVB peptidase [Desulfofundulus thermobenzoicus]
MVKAVCNPLCWAKEQNVAVGDPLLPGGLPGKILQVSVTDGNAAEKVLSSRTVIPLALSPGRVYMQVKLLGLIPLNHLVVNVVPGVRVIPGGHSIGILLHAQGVMVVGYSAIVDPQGQRHNPALEAGINSGDIILKINGRQAESNQQVRTEVIRSGEAGRPVLLDLKRGQRIFSARVKPVYCSQTRRYRIGLFIRDSAAGVGTLTYYDPRSNKYGALGHVICDMETSRRIDLADGRIVEAQIQGIHPGRRGQPGEKIGLFNGNGVMGDITKNSSCGIIGSLKKPLSNPHYREPVPVAMAYQVKEGPAEMLTVLKGNRVERFAVEIVQVMPHNRREGKGMVIKVTDPALLKKTGGIIQGMSGSPIIQEGKFVGAVTHVFINDPTRGYGVLAEWMLLEAGLVPVTGGTVEEMGAA